MSVAECCWTARHAIAWPCCVRPRGERPVPVADELERAGLEPEWGQRRMIGRLRSSRRKSFPFQRGSTTPVASGRSRTLTPAAGRWQLAARGRDPRAPFPRE